LDSERLQELRLRHHACSNADEVIALALEAEELRGLAKAAQMNYIEESLEAERLRAALDGHHAAWATKWENCSICRALAGTEAKDG